MSITEPLAGVGPRRQPPLTASDPSSARLLSLVTTSAVGTLLLTSVHHVYGAHRYASPWRLHVLLLAIPAIAVILASRRRLLASPTDVVARRILGLTTLVVPVLLIGAFEGVYNHVVKNVLFFHGAPASLMTLLFPPPTYAMPSDFFFEGTGCAQAVWGGAAGWYLLRFAMSGSRRRNRASDRAPARVRPRTLPTISAHGVPIPDPHSLVHLQFRRFAGCPVCNLHLREFVRRRDELRANAVHEVIVFHSSAAELREYEADLPFAIVPDPEKVLYAEFGVESSPRALLDPRASGAILRGVARSLAAVLKGAERLPPIRPSGGSLGLPGDFLIAPDGRVVAGKVGVHADDHWSVDEVLDLARTVVPPDPGLARAV